MNSESKGFIIDGNDAPGGEPRFSTGSSPNLPGALHRPRLGDGDSKDNDQRLAAVSPTPPLSAPRAGTSGNDPSPGRAVPPSSARSLNSSRRAGSGRKIGVVVNDGPRRRVPSKPTRTLSVKHLPTSADSGDSDDEFVTAVKTPGGTLSHHHSRGSWVNVVERLLPTSVVHAWLRSKVWAISALAHTLATCTNT